MGIAPGTRLVLMVRPGIEFIALTFAIFKAGAVVVLIDPGMGPRRVFGCLDQVDPQGFIAVPAVQALRKLSLRRFPNARFNVTVGRKWFWGGETYAGLMAGVVALQVSEPRIAPTLPTDPAAIIFTSGSTGPAKGVVYEHGMFAAQVDALRDYYGIEPGGIDLPGFPLFALFNAAMGVTTVVPDIDPTRPARVDPRRIFEGIDSQNVTQAFGSPAIWKRVGEFGDDRDQKLPGVRRVFSAGAPVSPEILRRMTRLLTGPDAEMFTPYGATEALPVCSIGAREVLARTAERTREGAGTCVGKLFPNVQLKIIEIADGALDSFKQARELPAGQIGEIVVRGPMVTREYFRQPEATARAKIPDGDGFWHRMGDVGYLDADGNLWFCGRKAHMVETPLGRLYTDCIEPIFNTHPRVFRTALVGIGKRPSQTPAIVIETETWYRPNGREIGGILIPELREIARPFPAAAAIERFLVYPGALPVDVRHNIKINREELSVWAEHRSR